MQASHASGNPVGRHWAVRGKGAAAVFVLLDCRQAEEGSQCRPQAEQGKSDGGRSGASGIASEPLFPREPIVCSLSTGKGRRLDGWSRSVPRLHLDIHALVTKELDARPSVGPTTPVRQLE